MNIARKFARRYYDAIILMAHPFVPDHVVACEYSRDGAIIIGNAIPIVTSGNISLSDDGENISWSADATHFLDNIDDAIAALTSCHTIKTGDIIAVNLPISIPIPMGYDSIFSLNSIPALRIKVR